ncbi:MAG TPA: ABC transporter permease subunit [Steroidobacteraceae bacterium]|nr:ABC transporter permease subunit [Steroidobacteraceae bacterium]
MSKAVNGFPAAGRSAPSAADAIAVALVIGVLALLADGSRGVMGSLSALQQAPISLDPRALPGYAVRTTLRMLVALLLSLVFTFTYATWAAKSERAARILLPLLDILQSVPILGFISVTVLFFLSLAPGRVLGAELAAVFAIFTSQAWNMAFSFYQSLRTVPRELSEAARGFGLSPWARFWRLEVPFAVPPMVWNMMMSMSGGWFFVVAAEAISVGRTSVTLPGVGSYIAAAVAARDMHAIGWAIATMFAVILLYDQFLFRPMIAWADRFRFEQEGSTRPPRSWVLDALTHSVLMNRAWRGMRRWTRSLALPLPRRPAAVAAEALQYSGRLDRVAAGGVTLLAAAGAVEVVRFLAPEITLADVLRVFGLGLITCLRVAVLIALASLVWVPVGVLVGIRPRVARVVQPLAQFLAAFPANLLFPVVVFSIVRWRLSPDIWLSPLMILGTQWYILFNVIAGASTIPAEMRLVSRNLGVRGWLWWARVALPAVFPFYVTGALTASGGSWNASIVAELASWGSTRAEALGLGSYIANATGAGDFHRVVLGIAVMSLFVIAINRLVWRRLYALAERKYSLS